MAALTKLIVSRALILMGSYIDLGRRKVKGHGGAFAVTQAEAYYYGWQGAG